ncbi:MAG: cupredoxin domain-containing protein [Armatimonadota bacterium]|nr:cupredoxin domain-containing protein [Armatimonadota bacterium]MDR7518436.1 cupredoxin domain-containing protein [Armatimonadota bacterium]MDR7549552.1 cupredoxin domain-containing protein [Armatimonadota bacterium]
MRAQHLLAALLIAGILIGLSTSAPAQTSTRKVFEVAMTSFKYEPNQLRFNEGDTVVIRLRNIDPFGRPHQVASTYLLNIPLIVRGDAQQGINEGRKFVTVEAGKQAEFEFVAQGRGSYAFICALFNHAINGQTGMLFVQPAGSP